MTSKHPPVAGKHAETLYKADGLEIHPVREEMDEQGGYCEQCEPEEAHFWSVYAHLEEGGVDCLEDFPTEAEARRYAERLKAEYPHLGDIFG